MPRRFEFRLESVLGYRQGVEGQKKNALALARRVVVEQNERLMKLLSEEEEGKRCLKELQRKTLDLDRVKMTHAYLIGLDRRIRKAHEVLGKLQEEEHRNRREWMEARRSVRVLEKLKERRHREWAYEAEREEQKVLDEVAQNQAVRKG